jgi:hypothetical protein
MMNQKSNEQLQCIAISCLQAVSLLVPSLSACWCVRRSLSCCCVAAWCGGRAPPSLGRAGYDSELVRDVHTKCSQGVSTRAWPRRWWVSHKVRCITETG